MLILNNYKQQIQEINRIKGLIDRNDFEKLDFWFYCAILGAQDDYADNLASEGLVSVSEGDLREWNSKHGDLEEENCGKDSHTHQYILQSNGTITEYFSYRRGSDRDNEDYDVSCRDLPSQALKDYLRILNVEDPSDQFSKEAWENLVARVKQYNEAE
jgi:hypothetical protein